MYFGISQNDYFNFDFFICVCDLNVFDSSVIGMLISYLFTRPRERWFKDQIVALVFELRQKSDELVDVTSKLKEEIEVNEIAVKHNKELHAKFVLQKRI